MATLKIDVVVDDANAAARLKNLEVAVHGVEAASAKGAAAAASLGSAHVTLANQSTSAFSRMSSAAGNWIKMASAVYGGMLIDRGIDAMQRWVGSAIKSANTLTDLSAKSGLTASALQKLDFIGTQAGVTIETFGQAAFRLGVRLAKGGDSVVSAVESLGLNFKAIQAMKPDQQMHAILLALSNVGSEQERNRIGAELFGVSFSRIAAAVTKDYETMWKAAKTSGDEQIKALDDASDAWDRFVKNRKADLTNLLGMMVIAGQQMKSASFLQWMTAAALGGGPGGVALRFAQMGMGRQPGEDISLPVDGAPKGFGESDDKPSVASSRAVRAASVRANPFLGASILAEADQAMRDLAQAGGLTALTRRETESLNRTLDEALEKYAALGRVAPRAMYDTWLATSLPQVGSSIAGIGQQLALPTAPLPPVPGLPMGGGLAGIGQSLPLPTMPATPGFFSQAFGSSGQLGAELSQTIMQAITGGGNVGSAIGGLLGGRLFGGQDGKGGLAGMVSGLFGQSGIGGMLGGALGSIIPGLGTMLGSMIGPLLNKIGGGIAKLFGRGDDGDKERDAFLKSMGGFNQLAADLHKLGPEGDAMFSALQRANSGKEANEAAEKIREALEEHAEAIREATQNIPAAVNARSANITSQHDFSTVGAQAMGAFQFLVTEGRSAVEALSAITPAIQAMQAAMATGNFEVTAAAERLFYLHDIVQQNKVAFDNLAASGQIMTAMLQANIRDGALFSATAADIGTQVQAIIDKGVPMEQVFALAQPQLQALWEAQQKFGFAVDESTQALLNQAQAQGFVGEQMMSVHERMLQVLVAIGDALGATIPNALRGLPGVAQEAANGMTAAFDGVKMPVIGDGEWRPSDAASSDVMHSGGLVGWRRMHAGGLASDEVPIIGQRGEYMVSRRGVASVGVSALDAINRGQGVGGGTANIYLDGRLIARAVVPHLPGETRSVVPRYS